MRSGEPEEGESLDADWCRLRRAAVFFALCLAVFLLVGYVGLFH